MTRKLTELEIDEISLVDRPANPAAEVLLVKSADPPPRVGLAARLGRAIGVAKAGPEPLPPEDGDDAAALEARLAELEAENAALRDRIAELEQGRPAELEKRAAAYAGIADPAALAPILAGLERTAPELAGRLERLLAAAQGRLGKGALYRGLGHAGEGGSAWDRLVARADALRRREPDLKREQAFARAYADPDNRELVEAYRAERRAR